MNPDLVALPFIVPNRIFKFRLWECDYLRILNKRFCVSFLDDKKFNLSVALPHIVPNRIFKFRLWECDYLRILNKRFCVSFLNDKKFNLSVALPLIVHCSIILFSQWECEFFRTRENLLSYEVHKSVFLDRSYSPKIPSSLIKTFLCLVPRRQKVTLITTIPSPFVHIRFAIKK